MPKKAELSAEQRLKIKILHERGMSQVKIAREVKCSRCAVQYALNRFKENGTHENRPRTGRRKITTDREDRLLIRQSLQDRKKTALELAAALSEAKSRSVSACTVRRRLIAAGLKGCKARKKPWLSEHNKKNRLQWALRHRDWTVEDWSNVLWSDESNFEARQFRVTNQVYFDIQSEEKFLGRIVIGLFGDLAPKAVKNFKVLASEGIQGKSYKGTSFNRIIKRFMIQGGDVVSDDGTGAISIYGEAFDDENLDTRHSGAGFVSMANKGRNTNGCQFLITTTGTPWLDDLHTVVGKVVEGQNIVHMVEHTPTDVDDRPTLRVYIADCGVVPTPQPYYISDDPYDLWAWIKASAVPLTMSFSILGFFHWMMRKMEI